MSYPQSNDVSSGQPTAYQHYNHLRADALRLGQAETDAVNLGEALSQFEDNLSLQYLASNRLRVPASTDAPVSLAIDGCLLRVTANVDLDTAAAPSGMESQYYVFAQRSAGSRGFTLTCNTSPASGAGQRLIGRCYWSGSSIVPGSIVTEKARAIEALTSVLAAQAPGGRLSLVSGDPYPQNISGSTLYYVPYRGNRIALYAAGRGWRSYEFNELSLSCSGWSSGRLRDIFVSVNTAGVLSLDAVLWTNDTTRGAPLYTLDGVLVSGGGGPLETIRRYVGTVRTSGSGVVADTLTQRMLYNEYNPLPHLLKDTDSTDHTYNLTTARFWNNDANRLIGLVLGSPRQVRGALEGLFRNSTGTNASSLSACVENAAGANLASISAGSATYLRTGNTFMHDAPAGYVRYALCEAAGASATLSAASASISMLVDI